jgi:dolichol-phosphate mannosyltransferase
VSDRPQAELIDVARALVTGAEGFLGANLVRYLIAAEHEVIALSRPGGTSWRLAEIADEVQIVEFDLREATAIDRLLAATKPQWVFHLAAHGAYSWQTDIATMISVNIGATAALLTAARAADVQAFVNVGSSSEYGRKTHAPDEQEWLEPNSYYAVTKAAGTHLTALAAPVFDLRPVGGSRPSGASAGARGDSRETPIAGGSGYGA